MITVDGLSNTVYVAGTLTDSIQFTNCTKVRVTHLKMNGVVGTFSVLIDDSCTGMRIENPIVVNSSPFQLRGGDLASFTGGGNIVISGVLDGTDLQTSGYMNQWIDGFITDSNGILFRTNSDFDHPNWWGVYSPQAILGGVTQRCATLLNDSGALYIGRSLATRVGFYNHKCTDAPHNAWYLDDCQSNCDIVNCSAINCGTGILYGGGRRNKIYNFTAVNCSRDIAFDDRNTDPAFNNGAGFDISEFNTKRSEIVGPWKAAFPNVDQDYTDLITTNKVAGKRFNSADVRGLQLVGTPEGLKPPLAAASIF